MNCRKCKDQDECDIYQNWLNTRDCCCPKIKENFKEINKLAEDYTPEQIREAGRILNEVLKLGLKSSSSTYTPGNEPYSFTGA